MALVAVLCMILLAAPPPMTADSQYSMDLHDGYVNEKSMLHSVVDDRTLETTVFPPHRMVTGGDVICQLPNDCTYVAGKPYCTSLPDTSVAICTACNPKRPWSICDCYAGEYCVKDPQSTLYGNCVAKSEKVFDRRCQEDLTHKGMHTRVGVDDQAFCGQIAYNLDGSARVVEWEGVCQKGSCFECGIGPITWPGLSKEGCNDARVCIYNKLGYSLSILNIEYFGHFQLMTAYYLLVLLFLIASLIGPLVIMGLIFGVFSEVWRDAPQQRSGRQWVAWVRAKVWGSDFRSPPESAEDHYVSVVQPPSPQRVAYDTLSK